MCPAVIHHRRHIEENSAKVVGLVGKLDDAAERRCFFYDASTIFALLRGDSSKRSAFS